MPLTGAEGGQACITSHVQLQWDTSPERTASTLLTVGLHHLSLSATSLPASFHCDGRTRSLWEGNVKQSSAASERAAPVLGLPRPVSARCVLLSMQVSARSYSCETAVAWTRSALKMLEPVFLGGGRTHELGVGGPNAPESVAGSMQLPRAVRTASARLGVRCTSETTARSSAVSESLLAAHTVGIGQCLGCHSSSCCALKESYIAASLSLIFIEPASSKARALTQVAGAVSLALALELGRLAKKVAGSMTSRGIHLLYQFKSETVLLPLVSLFERTSSESCLSV